MQGWREDWLHRLTDCGGSEQRVFEEVAEIVRTIGFQYCSFGLHLPSVGREARDLWFTNYPQPWLQNRYFAHDFQTIDPVIKAALRSLAPVTWSEDHSTIIPDGKRPRRMARVTAGLRPCTATTAKPA